MMIWATTFWKRPTTTNINLSVNLYKDYYDPDSWPPFLGTYWLNLFSLQKARQTVFEELGLNFDDLDDLQSLVDQVLSEKQEEEGFLIFLRLSSVPKYLVEGYDFKMLNRSV